MESRGCQPYTEQSSRNPQERAFRQALSHKPATARAKSHAHREFAFAGDRTRQHQAGHVGAGNE